MHRLKSTDADRTNNQHNNMQKKSDINVFKSDKGEEWWAVPISYLKSPDPAGTFSVPRGVVFSWHRYDAFKDGFKIPQQGKGTTIPRIYATPEEIHDPIDDYHSVLFRPEVMDLHYQTEILDPLQYAMMVEEGVFSVCKNTTLTLGRQEGEGYTLGRVEDLSSLYVRPGEKGKSHFWYKGSTFSQLSVKRLTSVTIKPVVATTRGEEEVDTDRKAYLRFVGDMRFKLDNARKKGRSGWWRPEECTDEYLTELFFKAVRDNDMVSVALYAMMLDYRDEKFAEIELPDGVARVTVGG